MANNQGRMADRTASQMASATVTVLCDSSFGDSGRAAEDKQNPGDRFLMGDSIHILCTGADDHSLREWRVQGHPRHFKDHIKGGPAKKEEHLEHRTSSLTLCPSSFGKRK